MLYVVGPISAVYLLRVALETKMADAQVEYKRVDLQSYEARNGASLAQSFKYIYFSFPSMYRRLKSLRAKANLQPEPPLNMAMHRE